MKKWIFASLIFLLSLPPAKAEVEVIEFPEEELATESVVPVFDNVESVKGRYVTTEKKLELGGGLGFSLTEAFYNPINLTVTGSYHFDEIHAFNVIGAFFVDGLSSYGNQLKNGEGLSGDTFDASRAPHPTYMVLGNYQFNAYYGKISITKKYTMNLSLYGFAGLGLIGMTDGSNEVGLNFGLGQKFYMSKRTALRFDLRMLINQGPDPTSNDLDTGGPELESGDFEKTTYFNILLNVGLVFLL